MICGQWRSDTGNEGTAIPGGIVDMAPAGGSRGASVSAAGGGALRLVEPENIIFLRCVVLLVIMWEQSVGGKLV